MEHTKNLMNVVEPMYYSVVKPSGAMVTDCLEDAMMHQGDGDYCIVHAHSGYESAYNECAAKLFSLSVVQGIMAFVPERMELGRYYELSSLPNLNKSIGDLLYSGIAEIAKEFSSFADMSELSSLNVLT